jgi:hypothetical protein
MVEFYPHRNAVTFKAVLSISHLEVKINCNAYEMLQFKYKLVTSSMIFMVAAVQAAFFWAATWCSLVSNKYVSNLLSPYKAKQV